MSYREELMEAAEARGIRMWRMNPVLGTLALICGKWYPVQLRRQVLHTKNGGRPEYSRPQEDFILRARDHGGLVFIWRTSADIDASIRYIQRNPVRNLSLTA